MMRTDKEPEINIDMWYGDKAEDVDNIDIFFSDVDCVYRGNCYIKGKPVGDYSATDSTKIEAAFPQLEFNYKDEEEPFEKE